MNEGWASYWHEKLFMQDDRIHGHEVDFSRVNAWVTALPQVGLNPYAIGLRMFKYIEEMADKGKLSFDFQRIRNIQERKDYDKKTGQGLDYIFDVRENYCDYTFIREFIDQDFVDKHKLFVTGKRLNQERMVWEYYVKSRKYNEYKNMMFDSLYHPPNIKIDQEKSENSELCLVHHFEGKPLVTEFIANTMIGVEYLWGAPVHLETSEPEEKPKPQSMFSFGLPQTKPDEEEKEEIKWKRVLYTMKDRKLTKKDL
jgi:stage V sporulation protein R